MSGSWGLVTLNCSRTESVEWHRSSSFSLHLTPISSIFQTIYNGSLSSSSLHLIRSYLIRTGYSHYRALQVTVRASGTYTFMSASSIDTYGYFYNHSFNPSYPSRNLVASDDDSGGEGQFLLSVNLTSVSSCVLIITTFGGNITGSFSIRASGPSSIRLTAFAPATIRSTGNGSKRIWKCIFYEYRQECPL